ncbi:hypothetical protein RF11_11398 [Thelohanellus kitauei]|uniref:Uncharacterized protein n=1 Tax=Thelohanellus kitauei TaxID=669202 RepID=A0A0C2NEE6_THEKT|nr:hypothetical protein RF11_11398 [Thelohanellus kitauei]
MHTSVEIPWSIAKTFEVCRKSVVNHLKMNEEQQTFLPAPDKCRKTCVQTNAMCSNMEQTIYHAIACENWFILLEVQDIVRSRTIMVYLRPKYQENSEREGT